MNGGCIVKVVKDPELRFGTDDKAWTKFRGGIESRVKSDGEWSTELTWCDVVVNGPLAERVAENVSKGTRLIVVGRLQAAPWTDKEGTKHEGLTLRADHVGLDLTFGLESSSSSSYGASSEPF